MTNIIGVLYVHYFDLLEMEELKGKNQYLSKYGNIFSGIPF